jgi:transcriptional regulator GlxA family with amidase domain
MAADHPRAVAILTFDGAQSLDVAGPLEAFAQAIECARKRGLAAPYTIEVLAERPGPVRTMSGLRIVADRGYARVRGGIDTLIVSGGDNADVEQLCSGVATNHVGIDSAHRNQDVVQAVQYSR